MHLKDGDSEPAIDSQRYTLYGFRFCPYTDRVKLVMAYHKMDHDYIPISLNSKPDWYLKLCPGGKVPLLTHLGEKLIESGLIMLFVDELYDNKLVDVCSEKKFEEARKLGDQFFEAVRPIIYNAEYKDTDAQAFHEACALVETSIKGPYYAGDELSLADLVLFPQLDRFEVCLGRIKSLSPDDVHEFKPCEPASCEWTNLVSYLDLMRQQSFVDSSRQTARVVARYSASKRDGNPDAEIE